MERSFQALAEKITIFHGLTDEQLGHLVPFLKRKEIKAGEVLVQEGDEASGMYLITEGEARLWKKGQTPKDKAIIGQLKAGDVFGEMSLIDCQKRSATVVAITDIISLKLPYTAMNELFEHHPKTFGILMLNIAREISRRLRKADQFLADFGLPL